MSEWFNTKTGKPLALTTLYKNFTLDQLAGANRALGLLFQYRSVSRGDIEAHNAAICSVYKRKSKPRTTRDGRRE